MNSKLHTLSLRKSLPLNSDDQRIERKVDRSILLEVAPDREELLSNISVEAAREKLKLCIYNPQCHWLKATVRVGGVSKPSRSKENLNDTYPTGSTTLGSNLEDVSLQNQRQANTWGTTSLTTEDILVSPRPLGPTHILVVSALSTRAGGTSVVEEHLELPINDLLFLLNVPNLMPAGQYGRFAPILPRRLHLEMPRVAMRVPYIETFAEINVYLHTKNRAALFRALIPEWIRDVMHPFTSVPTCPFMLNPPKDLSGRDIIFSNTPLSNPSCAICHSVQLDTDRQKERRIKHSVMRLLTPLALILKLVPCITTADQTLDNTTSVELLSLPYREDQVQALRSIEDTAQELQETSLIIPVDVSIPDGGLHVGNDTIHKTAAKLDALASNFEYLGYFETGLWTELDIYRGVISHLLEQHYTS